LFFGKAVRIAKKIKIINLLSRLNIGGPSVHAVLLTKYLNNERYESVLVSGSLSEGEGDMGYLLDDLDLRHLQMKALGREISLFNDFQAIWELYRLFRREKPDIVHTNMAKAGMIGRIAAFLAGVPIIVHTFHGHVFSGYFSPLKSNIFIGVEKMLSYISTAIITISRQIKDDICDRYRITPADKVSIIPLGFELDKFDPKENYRNYFRKKFEIADDAQIVGIVGRITAIKNHELFVKIAAHVTKKFPDVHYLVIGDGELKPAIEAMANNLDLAKRMHFSGWIRETAKIYADLDILLLTSINEGTPVTLIEAMHYAIPVISTAVGGVPDIIIDKQTGFLVNSFDPADFLRVIDDLINHPEKRNQAGNQAKKFIDHHFTIDRLVADITKFYDKLLYQKRILC
jgi:glycosyltransferase involved in cell wall biosynthesis